MNQCRPLFGALSRRSESARRSKPTIGLGVERLDGRCLPSGVAPLADVSPDGSVVVRPDRASVGKVIYDITYTHHGTREVQLDLYLPSGTPPSGGWPVILAFPGGGWRQASRKDYGGAISVFTHHGYAVAGVDYTYASQTGGQSWPTNFDDACAAVVWVRHFARTFDFNPQKIVAMGESSGAHLALLVGMKPDGTPASTSPGVAESQGVSSRVAAVVDFYGATNLTELYHESRPAVIPYFNTFLGGSPDQFSGRYTAASPLTYVNSKTPPILIVQGLSDPTVKASQSLELDSALTQAGVRHTLLTIPWARHGFRLNLGRFSFVPDILEFLNGALNNGPVPPSRSIG